MTAAALIAGTLLFLAAAMVIRHIEKKGRP
jgi:hypothetical protein